MTQYEMVKDHLDRFGSITPLEALKEYGIMRLASRMSDLKADGYRFKTETVTHKNKFGKNVSYARYVKEE